MRDFGFDLNETDDEFEQLAVDEPKSTVSTLR